VKIPKKVKIGPYDYTVERFPQVVKGGDVYYGRCFKDQCRIEIATSHPAQIIDVALMHEYLHGIDEVYDVGLEESQVDRLATGIMAFLKDNRLLRE